jgi:hypothetical protein
VARGEGREDQGRGGRAGLGGVCRESGALERACQERRAGRGVSRAAFQEGQAGRGVPGGMRCEGWAGREKRAERGVPEGDRVSVSELYCDR